MASLQVPETDVDDEDEEEERTDAALVKHDVIKVINRFVDSSIHPFVVGADVH